MYSFFRVVVSFDKWNWLAINIKGKSHVVSVSRGAERGSVKDNSEELRLLSPGWFK